MRDEYYMPRHLHETQQILWWDMHEFMVIVAFYIFANVFGGIAYLAFLFGPYLIITEKRKASRGFFAHTLLGLGFRQLKGYPDPSSRLFIE